MSISLSLANQEGQPFLRRQPTNANEQVQANVYQDLQAVQQYSPRILIVYLILAIVEMGFSALVLYTNWSSSCDRPLQTFILVFTARYVILLPATLYKFFLPENQRENMSDSYRNMVNFTSLFVFVWWIIGQVWAFGNSNCAAATPAVHTYAVVLISVMYFSIFFPFIFLLLVCLCMPCAIVLLRLFAEKKGATDSDISNIPTIRFKRFVQDPNSSPVMRGESQDTCAVCMVDYEPDEELRVLPCGHQFHKACIDQWLPVRRTCPYCRKDVVTTSASTEPVLSPRAAASSSSALHASDHFV